ncbi:MAG: transglutaminase-like domain-containing protein [Verrucomicrobiae bacterium]|nr:transglutaminase-like domain-containing protein [Verrucomicrobiae bacterium]
MSVNLTENQRSSVFRLLADDDSSTVSMVKRQLIEAGDDSVSCLEDWLKQAHGLPAERHLAEVLGHLKQGHCHRQFLHACAQAGSSSEVDLEEASFLLAATEYAATDMGTYRRQLDEIADQIRNEIKKGGPSSQIRALSHQLHEKLGFRGNRNRYFEADNTYINRVIERRVGVPLTLSLIYILLGRRLELGIEGVALPGHFIVTWQGKFFDPFNQGRLLNADACREMVEARGHVFREEHLKPASPRQVLLRMLGNLQRVYEYDEDRARTARIQQYLQALEGRS